MLYSQAVTMEEDVPLAPLTTLRVGGPARLLARIESEDDLVAAAGLARERGLRVFVLGGGSNLLVADAGFDGLVLRIALTGESAAEVGPDEVECTVAAGVDWDAFVYQRCVAGLCGVECLAGIPGLVGGTPVQNVGAYGQEVAETIVRVRAFDLEAMAFREFTAAECGFGYRRSRFNSEDRGRYVVTSVTFRLRRAGRVKLNYADLQRHFAERVAAGDSPTPIEVYHAVREIRQRKGMLLVEGDPDCRSAGSFFKNPVVPVEAVERVAAAAGVATEAVPHWPVAGTAGRTKLPAAWLLERAGFHKGYALGEAGISSKHTLALVNRGHARAAELLALRDRIQVAVAQRFGVRLEQEPVLLG